MPQVYKKRPNGYAKTPEHRAKLAAAAKARWAEPGFRERALAGMARMNVPWTEERRRKHVERVRGRKHTPESRAKISKGLKGRAVSPESIAKGNATRDRNTGMTKEERRRHYQRKQYGFRLWKRYRIREHDIALLLEAQNRKCLCGADVSSLSGYEVHIDHCHETGAVRGILCTACNWNLGQVERLVSAWGWDRLKEYLNGRPDQVSN